MFDEIGNFFYPRSVCVAGASSKEKSIGYEILKSILTFGYKGDVFPVNPKSKEILGYKTYSSISEIPFEIDLGIIVVPKKFVADTLKEFISKNVKSVIIVTAGFKETGREGAIEENELIKIAKENKVRIVGPNCMGVINSLEEVKLNATFVAEKPKPMPVAFLSQSGALGAAVINSLRESDIRFSHFISVGNKADINENHLSEFWENDKNISVTTYYLESFVNGFEFILPFIKGERKKTTVILKAGRSEAGIKAAMSHTGALGSSDKVVDALLKQFGIIRVDNIDELFNTAKAYLNFPIPKGNKIAIVTNAGGPAILTTDSLEKNGLQLSSLEEKTRKKLREIVHPAGSIMNPIDLLPGATADIYKKVNEIVISDKNVDAAISIFVEPVMVQPSDVVNAINSINSKKPIYQVIMPLPEFWERYLNSAEAENREKYVPVFRKPEEPAKVISNILFATEKRKKIKSVKSELLSQIRNHNKFGITGEGMLNYSELINLAKKYEIPIGENRIVKNSELRKTNFKFPLVIKGINTEITHKSELNIVKLNIKSKNQLLKKAKEIRQIGASNNILIKEFLIQPYIKGRFELLIGGFRDVSFGPIIMFGQGGKYVEQINDVALRSAFLSNFDVIEMIEETKIGKILGGVRGEKPVNISKLTEIILSAAKMIRENNNLIEFDINPLIVDFNDNYTAVDFRVKVR